MLLVFNTLEEDKICQFLLKALELAKPLIHISNDSSLSRTGSSYWLTIPEDLSITGDKLSSYCRQILSRIKTDDYSSDYIRMVERCSYDNNIRFLRTNEKVIRVFSTSGPFFPFMIGSLRRDIYDHMQESMHHSPHFDAAVEQKIIEDRYYLEPEYLRHDNR